MDNNKNSKEKGFKHMGFNKNIKPNFREIIFDDRKNNKSKFNNQKNVKRESFIRADKKTDYKEKRYNKNNSPVKIIPLGGLDRIGINITAFEYENDIIVVDCGLGFPEEEMLGVDLVIPNVSYLERNIHKVKAFFITHGHEDHIGALPYVLKNINVPVYSTRLTKALIEKKLEEHNMLDKVKLKLVSHGDVINSGRFGVEFIRTNHSIQDASALAIYSPEGIILHTGDFKVDYTPVFGDAINLGRFAELGKKGVLAMLSDSTNAERPGSTMSEKTVGITIDNIFNHNKDNRLIIATFASNVDRVQQILNIAKKYDRKVVVEGRSMTNIIEITKKIGYLDVGEDLIIEANEIARYKDSEVCVISTGSQGEAMAALSRMATGLHKFINISEGDTVVFSSHPIPGNEKAVSRVINDLYKRGAEVIFQDVHVSGHACQEDLKLLYCLLNPKYAVPIHGEIRHRKANCNIAIDMGIEKENVLLIENGHVLSLTKDEAKVIDKVECGGVFVDGLGVGDIGDIVIRDRQKLSEDGIFVATVVLDKIHNSIKGKPSILTRGFVYVKESEDLLDEAERIIKEEAKRCILNNIKDWNTIKTSIKDSIGRYLWEKTKRKPMILVVIVEG